MIVEDITGVVASFYGRPVEYGLVTHTGTARYSCDILIQVQRPYFPYDTGCRIIQQVDKHLRLIGWQIDIINLFLKYQKDGQKSLRNYIKYMVNDGTFQVVNLTYDNSRGIQVV